LIGLLGAAHILVVIVLLPTLLSFGFFSLFIVVPGLIWLIVLGIQILRKGGSMRKALRNTHLVLAPLAVLFIIYGIYCLRAAQRSAEGGGGLIGAVGLVPIVMGVVTVCLSIGSLLAINTSMFKEQIGD
jgi:hypothetical protein